MPKTYPDAIEFLLNRRSRPAKTLSLPIPNRDEILKFLTAAARSPDHGKLEPWRFIVLNKPKLTELADLVEIRAAELAYDQEKTQKGKSQFTDGNLAVAVIEVQKPSDKIPAIEQTYSAGAVCLALLNIALASGWGANWLSGWPSHDRAFAQNGLGLSSNERIAGIIYFGTETSTPPDRPRPNLDNIVTWQ